MPTEEHAEDPAGKINRFLWILAVATCVVYLALGGVIFYAVSTSQTNQKALCAFRGDLEDRIASGTKFLSEHPKGIAGIPATTLRTNLNNQKRVVKAFSIVDCPPLLETR